MLPRSSTLFHFTKNLETLTLVLKNGFWPRYCLEDIRWHETDLHQEIAYPMVCFCDIPISRIDEHVDFYGSYGIGVTKEWAIKNKLNPLTYVSSGSPVQRALIDIISHVDELPDDKRTEAFHTLRLIHSFAKPISGTMKMGRALVKRDFYQESEWRYVPEGADITQHLTKSVFDNKALRDKLNQVTFDSARLGFSPQDVKYIFVPEDSDIPKIINFIQNELDDFKSADLKVLMSRVTSLENLQRDL